MLRISQEVEKMSIYERAPTIHPLNLLYLRQYQYPIVWPTAAVGRVGRANQWLGKAMNSGRHLLGDYSSTALKQPKPSVAFLPIKKYFVHL